MDIAAFEILKEHLLEHYQGTPPPFAILGAGMLSSSVAQFASYPLALVRTRLQVSGLCLSLRCACPKSGPQKAGICEPPFWSEPLMICCWMLCCSECNTQHAIQAASGSRPSGRSLLTLCC